MASQAIEGKDFALCQLELHKLMIDSVCWPMVSEPENALSASHSDDKQSSSAFSDAVAATKTIHFAKVCTWRPVLRLEAQSRLCHGDESASAKRTD